MCSQPFKNQIAIIAKSRAIGVFGHCINCNESKQRDIYKTSLAIRFVENKTLFHTKLIVLLLNEQYLYNKLCFEILKTG